MNFVEVTKVAMGQESKPFMLNMDHVTTYQNQDDGRCWVVAGQIGMYIKGHIVKRASGGYAIKTLF